MKPQIQPNNWSCLPTAFAMLLDVKVESLIQKLGHDGSSIWFPNRPEPQCRRSFHPQEFVDLLFDKGYDIITIEANPKVHPDNPLVARQIFEICENRIKKYMEFNDCVLSGKTHSMRRHAVVWCEKEQLIYDPNGRVGPYDGKFAIEHLFIVRKLSTNIELDEECN